MLSKHFWNLLAAAIVALAVHTSVAALWREAPTANPPTAPQRRARFAPISYQPAIRPSVAFTSPSADANTSGGFTVSLAFDNHGGSDVRTQSFELRASREVTFAETPRPAGENLADFAGFVNSLSATNATVTVDQTAAGKLFANGEFVLYARVANEDGHKSEWASRRFYVEGASAAVVKVPTMLKQGDAQVSIAINGTALESVIAADFGANITVHTLSATSGQVTATLSVDETCQPGPRAISLYAESSTSALQQSLVFVAGGIANVVLPTDRLPASGATEAPRNAAKDRGVILSNGGFTLTQCDLSIAEPTLDLEFTRTYRSDIAFDGPLGHGWRGHYFQRAELAGANIRYYAQSGHIFTFTAVAGGFTAPAGVYLKATRETTYGTISVSDPQRNTLVFNAQGRLWLIVDRNNNRVECHHNHLGQLTSVEDERGRKVHVNYGADGRVENLRDKIWSEENPRVVKYVYNAMGELIKQKAPETARYFDDNRIAFRYAYDASHRLTTLKNPREFEAAGPLALELDYRNNRVVARRDGGSGNWAYFRYPNNGTRRVVDPRGLRTDYAMASGGTASAITRYTGFWEVDTAPSFNQATITQIGAKLRSTDPDSFVDAYSYNLHFEVLTHTRPRGNQTVSAYPIPLQLENGTVSAIDAQNLTDSAKTWTVNQFAGQWLRVGEDAGNYRYYVIVANGADTLTVADFEDFLADGFAANNGYAIFSANPDPLAAGNCLSVTRKDGPVGNAADIVTSTSYEPHFQFPKTITDERGYVTTLTYGYELEEDAPDPNHANLTNVLLPEVLLGQPSAQTIQWSLAYNTKGQLTSRIDPAGVVTQLSYFDSGAAEGYLRQTVIDPAGLAITHEYERNIVGEFIGYWPPRAHAAGADKDSFKCTVEVNELGQCWHIIGPKLRETGDDRGEAFYYFDANGNGTHEFLKYVSASGEEPAAPGDVNNPATFAKSDQPMAPTWIETTWTYNSRNQLDSRAADINAGDPVIRATTTFEYDASFNLAATVSPELRRDECAFDERNLPFTVTEGAGSSVAGTTRRDYDGNGNLARILDARSFEDLFVHDGFERLTRITDAAGHYRTFVYDAASNCTARSAFSSSDVLLAQETAEFDEAGRVWRRQALAKDHLGFDIGDGLSTVLLVHDASSRLAQFSDDLGRATEMEYDDAGRLTLQRDAALNEIEWTYDAAGGVTRRTHRDYDAANSAFETRFAEADLDRLGRVLRVRNERYSSTFNTQTTFSFDSLNNVVSASEPGSTAAAESVFQYDLRGLPIHATLKPSGSLADFLITAAEYDADGLLVRRSALENAASAIPHWQDTTYARDVRGRIGVLTRPDGEHWDYTYDACSNLATQLDPMGTSVAFTYDGRGYRTQADITRGEAVAGATQETWAFDGLGRMILAAALQGEQAIASDSFGWNTLGLCEAHSQSLWRRDGVALGTRSISQEYDATGFCTAIVNFDGRRIEQTQDPLGRLLSASDAANEIMLAEFSYVGDRLAGIDYGNGTDAAFIHEPLAQGDGGKGALPIRAAHSFGAMSLFLNDARYDTAGNLTATRNGHDGGTGKVLRYDNMPRGNYFKAGPIRIRHQFDNFSVGENGTPLFKAGTIRIRHQFDNFKAGPIRIRHQFDNFSTDGDLDETTMFKSGTVRIRHQFDDFKAGPIRIRHQFDNFSADGDLDETTMFKSGTIRIRHQFDNFSADGDPDETTMFKSGTVRIRHQFDNFKAGPIRIRHQFDNFSAGGDLDETTMFKSGTVRIRHQFDNFKAGPIRIRHQFDNFSVPGGARLLNSYYGVDMFDNVGQDDLAGFGNPASTPSLFALGRSYALDCLSNRSGENGARDFDELGNTVHGYAFTVATDKTNRYNSVDGDALGYNATQRITSDAATGLHHAYDWAGRLALIDDDADLASPSVAIGYDALGRRVIEERFYDAAAPVRYSTEAALFGCGDKVAAEIAFAGDGTVLSQVQFLWGPAPGSLLETVPDLAGAGGRARNESVIHEFATSGTQTAHRFRHEDVEGRLMGVTDIAGLRSAEYGYTDFGTPLLRRVLFDSRGHGVTVQADTPSAGQTTINFPSSPLTAGALVGRELCVSLPSSTSDRYRCATILSNTDNSIVVRDGSGRIFNALDGTGALFTVFAFNDVTVAGAATPATGGNWSAEPDYDLASETTFFEQTGATFAGFTAGWMVAANAERGGQAAVHSTTAGGINLRGNASGLAAEGSRFRIYAPIGVNAQGASELDLLAAGSRYLVRSRRHVSTLAGYFDGVNILGAQSGRAKQGTHLHGARHFDSEWGRLREASLFAETWLNRFER